MHSVIIGMLDYRLHYCPHGKLACYIVIADKSRYRLELGVNVRRLCAWNSCRERVILILALPRRHPDRHDEIDGGASKGLEA